jgi:hypothetical protein
VQGCFDLAGLPRAAVVFVQDDSIVERSEDFGGRELAS